MVRRFLANSLVIALWLVSASLMVGSLGALVALSDNSTAAAVAAQVKIFDLDCVGPPEVVQVENEGPDSQDLTGWKLLSHPTAAESFDLSPIGSLPAGSQVLIESGPSAQSTFQWSTSQIFRDNDATDFARLVDDAGQTRDEKACAAQATASPSPSPSPAPTPSPTTAPAVDVPNGGGPPVAAPDLPSSPLVVALAGGSLLGLGSITLSVAWLGRATRPGRRGGRAQTQVVAITAPHLALTVPRASRVPQDASRPLLLALVAAITAAIVVAMFSNGRMGHRRS